MERSGDTETCPQCGIAMQRVYTAPQVSVPATGYFNHGLGQYVGNRRDIRDAMTRIHDTTGREVVEVGDQKTAPEFVRSNYKIPNELADKILS